MKHLPVLQNEVISLLDPKPNQNFIDATLGFGGHAKLILEKTKPNGKLIGIEQDIEAIDKAKSRLIAFIDRLTIVNDNFTELGLIMRKEKLDKIHGILIDLGPNTEQLKSEERGFSFSTNALLDMRMDPIRLKLTAADILNKFSEKEISKILLEGEEKFSKAISKKIIKYRRKRPITTTVELVEIIKSAIPARYRFEHKTHFATATFRALRLKVNNELENLKQILPQAVSSLSSGGRIAVISFHSLEDRIVKNFFRDNNELEILTSKPIIASEDEISNNPSARSAKLRVAKKK